jgi:hypothetical protein
MLLASLSREPLGAVFTHLQSLHTPAVMLMTEVCCMQDRAMSSGDTKFRQLLVELQPPMTAASTWVQVKRAVSILATAGLVVPTLVARIAVDSRTRATSA